MEKLHDSIEIHRGITATKCPFTKHFKGFNRIDVVRRIFGLKATETLDKLMLEFTRDTLYLRVDNTDGHLLVNPDYFLEGNATDIYLDAIHELVHVKQFMDGKRSCEHVNYVERPLEIEAYGVAVGEARILGLREDRILEYLGSELVKNEDLVNLAKTLEVNNDELTAECGN